jgi:D-alanyl-D-alanine carboxypeptidase/D-alanyl-D-alanine-endopeptidase (penicillin-binding protein 4)
MNRRFLLSLTLLVTAPLAVGAPQPAFAVPAPESAVTLPATQSTGPAWMTRRLEAVLTRYAPARSHVGVSVVSLADGAVVYERQADKLFLPASVQKLLTSAAALSLLGSQKRFNTRVMAEGLVENGRLRGHLYLKGEGDPTLEAEDLEALAGKIASAGIREIAGDLVTDATTFQPTGRVPEGWAWDDLAWSYGAPPSALSLHRNSVDVVVAPGAQSGDPVRLAVTPQTAYVQLKSQATTHATGTPSTLQVAGGAANGAESWVLTGHVPAGSAQETLSRSVADPARFAGTILKEALTRRGVTLVGRVRPGATPSAARTLAGHASPMLADLVRLMNKESDNLIAETLLLQLGIRAKGGPGSWD